ncbi:right-handed parallel beta-helix repeat-containing protein [Ulvibacter antarcticus]|uniref:Secreted protein (Por secretion system target) n=1 Tax=Ulvibacter antarcticus TaxID=442714 RepID=A0A3L9Y8Y6_9FLAO|nr:hypothetical protein [Ulvibacter antarcticus]RMA57166.1 hypothetical protein BXY75_3053 [Ulvibacter antarcticus]
MKLLYYLFVFSIFSFPIYAADIHVPADYTTIQEAIDAANNGDTVIVENGIYYENINLLGKEIILTSNFHFTGDVNDIINTIINGSQPVDSDFGSCVTFTNGENQNTILKGFTLTEGSGTKTYNPAEDLFFRTGGGILINNSSPTITNNIIRDNVCTAETGVFGAGGGGIRMGFGQPLIKNNIIKDNTGGYAGGIMIAYCGGSTLKNNLIARNTATGSFNGGGGVYVDWESITLENNTIVNNHSGDRGGGMISTGTSTVVVNCIFYGNTATNGSPQIYKRFTNGNAEVTYSNIEGGFDGMGNEEGLIDVDPIFDNVSNFLLDASSPCIDAGNPDSQYYDIENPASPGNALFPAQGLLLNDMGANGGQGSESFLSVSESILATGVEFLYKNPYQNEGITLQSNRSGHFEINLFSYDGKKLSETIQIDVNEGITQIPLTINHSCIVHIVESNGTSTVLKLIKL